VVPDGASCTTIASSQTRRYRSQGRDSASAPSSTRRARTVRLERHSPAVEPRKQPRGYDGARTAGRLLPPSGSTRRRSRRGSAGERPANTCLHNRCSTRFCTHYFLPLVYLCTSGVGAAGPAFLLAIGASRCLTSSNSGRRTLGNPEGPQQSPLTAVPDWLPRRYRRRCARVGLSRAGPEQRRATEDEMRATEPVTAQTRGRRWRREAHSNR